MAFSTDVDICRKSGHLRHGRHCGGTPQLQADVMAAPNFTRCLEIVSLLRLCARACVGSEECPDLEVADTAEAGFGVFLS